MSVISSLFSAEWSVESGRHSPRSQCLFAVPFHIFNYSYTHIIPAIACFLHFVVTEDSLKVRSSLETECNASERMEGMTEDLEGISVNSMRRNHFCLFLTKWEKGGRRARASKN